MAIHVTKAFLETVACPLCHEVFTYKERVSPLEGHHLPVALICGHKMCLQCARTETDKARKNVTGGEPSFLCSVCSQALPLPEGSDDADLVKVFPIDVYTIGLLAAADNFGPAYLSHLTAPLEDVPISLQPDLAIALTDEARKREFMVIEKTNICGMCACSAVDWRCDFCTVSFCFLCSSEHQTSCSAGCVAVIPYDSNGNLFPALAKNTEVTDRKAENSMNRDEFSQDQLESSNGLVPASAEMPWETIEVQDMDCLMVVELLEKLTDDTASSIRDLQAALTSAGSRYNVERSCLIRFFDRLQTSVNFASNGLVQKHMEMDGKRFTVLQKLTKTFSLQNNELKFLRMRWDSIVAGALCQQLDLRREQQAFENELLSCVLWDSGRLFLKRLKMDRFTGATWDMHIPKGLRSSLSKSRSEISLPDEEIGAVLDAAPVSTFLIASEKCGQTIYEFIEPIATETKESSSASKKSTAPTIDELRTKLHNVDGLVPRVWNPDYTAQIDSCPSLCIVTSIEDPPDSFWIRLASRMDEFENLTSDLEEYCENCDRISDDLEILPDDICGAKVQSVKDGLWNSGRMRVQVICLDTTRNDVRYRCRVVDLGQVMTFKKSKLRRLPRYIQLIKPLALRSKLHGFTPYHGTEMGRWPPRAREHFFSWLRLVGTPFVILQDIVNEQLIVDMFSDCGVQSLKEFLMFMRDGTLTELSNAYELHRMERRAVGNLPEHD